jgi:hypothetical protein
MKKYQLPTFLEGVITQAHYERWLHRKAMAHIKRDRKRRDKETTNEEYKVAIHRAVQESQGKDAYTDEPLDWTLLSTYDNEESKAQKAEYKKRFALLPSVDHVGSKTGPTEFKICGWRTNDAKNDLNYQEFVDLCKKVIDAANNRCTGSPINPASGELHARCQRTGFFSLTYLKTNS